MHLERLHLLVGLVAGGFTLCPAQPTASVSAPAGPPAAAVDPTQPIPRKGYPKFFTFHESFLERGKAGPIGLLFVGDSITAGWNGVPEIWKRAYERFEPANFGIGGDRTEHVIWRIENGELDGIAPKVVVLMIGTNNSADHPAGQIAAANRRIVSLIRAKLPQTKVLVLGIFPRGPRKMLDGRDDPWEQRMQVIQGANAELAKLDDGDHVRFLDIGPAFLAADGTIRQEIMRDQLHLTPHGYELWAETMQPLLDEMMK